MAQLNRSSRVIVAVAALAAVHVFLLWMTLSRHLDPLFNDAQHRLGPATDFAAYYRAGQGVLAGTGPYGHGPGFGFRYHPVFAATIGAALARLTVWEAYAVWVVLQEIAYAAFAWMLLKCLVKGPRLLAAGILLTLFSPYYLEVYMGNASFLTGVLLLAVVLLERRGRSLAAAVLLTVSIIIKPVGLVLLPWLLMRRRWHTVALVVRGHCLGDSHLPDESSGPA